MSDPKIKEAVEEMARLLWFDMGAVLQHIDALNETFRRIHAEGGGSRTIQVTLAGKEGHRVTPRTPVIMREELVQRRKNG